MEAQCVNCGTEWLFNPALEEPNVCMQCGEELCPQCYDESPYCRSCEYTDNAKEPGCEP